MRNYLLMLSLFFCSVTFAQNTITGTVTDSNNQPIPGANIKISGDKAGAITDGDGKFTIKSTKALPFTIEFSAIGFGCKKVTITEKNQNINIALSGG